MTTRTPSQRGAYSRRKGATAERDLCRWLRANGFPDAERAVRTAFRAKGRESADPGDTRGTDALIVSCKDVDEKTARKPSMLNTWWRELDAMEGGADAPRILVHKRAGCTDVGEWHCWMRHGLYVQLTGGMTPAKLSLEPVRMPLRLAVQLLRHAGHGDPCDHCW